MKDPYLAALEDILDTPDAIIFDTETTGFGKDDRIIELSAIDLDGNVLISELIDPGIPLPSAITELTGITDEMLSGRPRFADISTRLASIFWDCPVFAWNASFDVRMVKQEYAHLAEYSPIPDALDIMRPVAKLLGFQNGQMKLVNAKTMLGIGKSQDHRSLADCRDTLAVMKATVEKLRRDEQPSLFDF